MNRPRNKWRVHTGFGRSSRSSADRPATRRCQADHAKDEQVAEILRGIASDEARHAGLAWRFVAWTLEAHPQLRSVVEAAFAQADRPGASVGPAGDQDSELLVWGCASPTQRTRWRSLAKIERVPPCAARLLAG